ncbi:hypothetical protein AAEY27_04305 [Kosakonia sp. BYX6]|uniref:Uncharacterized protein n=1 Tax=Kosakonia calanthes TaxID=3139408 RepID=A0ABZ3BBQ4_9ENTR
MIAAQNKFFPLAGLMYALRICARMRLKLALHLPANASSSFSRRGDEESFEASERYGIEQGTESGIVFYRAMQDMERRELTPFGREMLAELHDHFIVDLDEYGWPEMPAAH